jgi:hypothetical protein
MPIDGYGGDSNNHDWDNPPEEDEEDYPQGLSSQLERSSSVLFQVNEQPASGPAASFTGQFDSSWQTTSANTQEQSVPPGDSSSNVGLSTNQQREMQGLFRNGWLPDQLAARYRVPAQTIRHYLFGSSSWTPAAGTQESSSLRPHPSSFDRSGHSDNKGWNRGRSQHHYSMQAAATDAAPPDDRHQLYYPAPSGSGAQRLAWRRAQRMGDYMPDPSNRATVEGNSRQQLAASLSKRVSEKGRASPEPQENMGNAEENTAEVGRVGGPTLATLPLELRRLIAEHLSSEDLLNFSETARAFPFAEEARRSIRFAGEVGRIHELPIDQRQAELDRALAQLPTMRLADRSRSASIVGRQLSQVPDSPARLESARTLWSQVTQMPLDANLGVATQNLNLLWFPANERAARLNQVLDVHQALAQHGLFPRTPINPLTYAANQLDLLPDRADRVAAAERIRSIYNDMELDPGPADIAMNIALDDD